MNASAAASLQFQSDKTVDNAAQGLRLGLGLSLAALVGLTVTVYAMPIGASAHYWGLNREGLEQFRLHWGLSALPRLGMDSYSTTFRLLLVVLWCGYALAVISALQGAFIQPNRLICLVIGTATLMAIFFPPLLSHDVYAYAAHGRLFALYGKNPYFQLPVYLKQIKDPVAAYLTWNWPTVYGPVWTRVEILLADLLRGLGLMAQVVALKLVEAAALVGAALAGRRITAHLSPGRENLTLLAIGMNPLLLLEGPGSGHNDLLLISLLLVGTMFYLEKKFLPALLFLGLSVGIKLITLAVLPWVWMEWGRGKSWRLRLFGGCLAMLLALAPTMISYFGLWHGWATLSALQARSMFHVDAATLEQNTVLSGWLLRHGFEKLAASCLVTLFQNRVIVAAFILLTLWLSRSLRPAQWLTAWAIVAVALMFFAMGLPFPWYICWFWPIFLLRWNKIDMIFSTLCFCLALTWTAGYGILNN